MVGNCIVDAELFGQPLCQGLEAAAQDGYLVAQSLQCSAEFTGAGGDGQDRLESIKNICWNTLEQTDALLQRCGEVQFAIHGPLSDFLELRSVFSY